MTCLTVKAAALAFAVLILPGSALCQGTGASIDEGTETVSLYVDPGGSDSNPGTQQFPFKTIGAAANAAILNNQNGIGTTVIIDPGTYREAISLLSSANDTSLPITFEAATNGTVIISGADVWSGWQPYSSSQIFTNFWPYQWGECAPSSGGPLQPDIVLRREMIFVNGTALTQVLSLAEVTSPATFYVDETNSLVYVWPPTGTDMSTATVEVSTRPSLFSINGNSNIVLRGLTFQYANSCRFASGPGGQAVVALSSNILFDTDNFVSNNSQGLNLANPASQITVENSMAEYNGQSGFQAYDLDNVLWQNDQASYNNWRGAQGVFYSWNSAGLHSYGSHDTSFDSVTTNLNQTYGMHWDWDHFMISTDSLFSSGNLLSAGLFEASEGPATISSSYFCNSGASDGGGLRVRDVQSLSLTNDTFYNNGTSQIMVVGSPGGQAVTNWKTNEMYQLITQDLTATDNVVEAIQSQQVFQDGDVGIDDWNGFVQSLTSNANTWWNASNPTPFVINALSPTTMYSFSGWQALTGQDGNSFFQPPANDLSAACAVTASTADYWFNVNSGTVDASSGTPAVLTVTVASLGGFAGTVQLNADGLQNIPGASGSWSQSSITGFGTATFTVSVNGASPPGSYPVVLIASSGNLTHTATVMVMVDTNVSLTRTRLDFGNVERNVSVSQVVNFINGGKSPLAVTIPQPGGAFSEVDSCQGSVAAGATCPITVTFTPSAAGPQSGFLAISDPDPSTSQTITLTGNGTLAPITLAPSGNLDFGTLQVGSSQTQQLTLTNPGTQAVSINTIRVIGANLTEFGQTNTCGTTLAAGGSCTITATFAPTAAGSRSAILLFEDNAQGSPQTVNLGGTATAPSVTLSPASLTFGTQLVKTTSAVQSVTLMNSGTAPLTIIDISVTGQFGQTNTCGGSVEMWQSCTISVIFTPTTSGRVTGSVVITDNASGGSQTIGLTGTGTYVKLTPASLNFGKQKIGSSSAAKNVTFTNTSRSTLSITGISIVGTNAGDFTKINHCGKRIGGGASCTINVVFMPAAAGMRAGSVSVSDNGGGSPQSVTLSGLGVP